jgi:hypothetical protein
MAKLDKNKAAPVPAITPEGWAEHVARVKEARGKFAWVRTSSEDFSRRKQEEIDLEEEKSERRMR